MPKKCLLLKFPDNREFFTYKKHYQKLLNFAESFGVKLILVEADFPKLLQIDDIAKVFCNQSQDLNVCNYSVVNQTRKNQQNGTRSNMFKRVYDVRTNIEEQFLEGKIVRIKELHHRFQEHNIAVSTLYRHLTYVKTKLTDQGKKIVKISTGCYRIA